MATSNACTLADCHAEQTCQIVSLSGDLDTKLHLVNLGFHTHSHIKISFIHHHSLIVIVDGSRFAIDKKLAENIHVSLLS